MDARLRWAGVHNNKLDAHVQVARWLCSPSDADCIANLPRCITTLRRCIKNANERVSAVVVAMRRPSCRKKSIADSSMAQKVSRLHGNRREVVLVVGIQFSTLEANIEPTYGIFGIYLSLFRIFRYSEYWHRHRYFIISDICSVFRYTDPRLHRIFVETFSVHL